MILKCQQRNQSSVECDVLAEQEKKQEEMSAAEKVIDDDNKARYEKRVSQFIESLQETSSSKEQAFSKVCGFLAEYLNIPSVYLAVKKTVGETECLHYYNSSPGQEKVIGVKMMKPADAEGDEAPIRQGLSFEAFKIPEVPEEEPVELEEGQEPPPPKPAPKAQPLIIENVMRDKRCKFFGIPMLGSYAAIPLILGSIEHDAGCILGPQPEPVPPSEDPEAPPPQPVEPLPLYVPNKIPIGILIGMDTIGAFRRFSPRDISTAVTIGEALVGHLETLEASLFEKQFAFNVTNTPLVQSMTEIATKIPEQEAAALAQVAADIGEAPTMDTLKASKEADAIASVYKTTLTTSPASNQIELLIECYLPPVVSAINLLFGVLCFLGMDGVDFKDVCGDISWEKLRCLGLPSLLSKIKEYNHEADELPTMSDAAFKAYLESAGLSDLTVLPSSIPVLSLIATWTLKQIAAREARVAYKLAKEEADRAAAEAAEAAALAEAEAAAAAAAAAAEE